MAGELILAFAVEGVRGKPVNLRKTTISQMFSTKVGGRWIMIYRGVIYL